MVSVLSSHRKILALRGNEENASKYCMLCVALTHFHYIILVNEDGYRVCVV